MNQHNEKKHVKFDLSKALDGLSLKSSLNENLKVISESLEIRYSDITRISVGIYDEKTNTLKAFLSNKGAKEPLAHLEANVSSLSEISNLVNEPNCRIVRHLDEHPDSYTAQQLLKQGYKSSYLASIFEKDQFLGIVTLSSSKAERFDRAHIRIQLDVVIKLISILVVGEIYAIKGLKGTAHSFKMLTCFIISKCGDIF